MSDLVPPTDEFSTDHRSFVIGIPAETVPFVLGEYGTYLRLGSVNADEALLQQDPSVEADTATLIGTGYSAAFSAGTLSYSIGTTQIVAPRGYMRFGAPTPYETWLATDPDAALATVAPPATAPTTPPFNYDGILLHSTGTLGMFAPTINQTAQSITTTVDDVTTWAGSSLSAVFNGGNLASVTAVGTDKAPILSTSTVSVGDNYSAMLGSNITSMTGNAVALWAGNNVSAGTGAMMFSNLGTTANVFAGQVVNITNGAIDVSGAGATKLSDFVVMAPEEICLGIAPTAPVNALSAALINLVKAINIAGTLVVSGFGAGIAAVTLGMTDIAEDTDKRADVNGDLRDYMAAFKIAMRVLDGLVAAVQIAAVFAGIATTRAAAAAASETPLTSSKITMTNGSMVLEAGGTKVTIGAGGFRVDAGDPIAMPLAIAAYGVIAGSQPLTTASVMDAYAAASYWHEDVTLPALWMAAFDIYPPGGPPAITLNAMLVKTAALEVQNSIYTP